jgi:hypothetical protein
MLNAPTNRFLAADERPNSPLRAANLSAYPASDSIDHRQLAFAQRAGFFSRKRLFRTVGIREGLATE